MKRCAVPLAMALFLTGCGPVSTYYREGASVERLSADQTACEVAALRDAPVANEIRQRPPVFYPPRQVCNSAGQCYTQPGYWVDGPIYTVDVNKALRQRVFGACMADKGYSLVSLPRCPQGTSPRASTRLPPLGPDTCVIPGTNGIDRIVTPPLQASSE